MFILVPEMCHVRYEFYSPLLVCHEFECVRWFFYFIISDVDSSKKNRNARGKNGLNVAAKKIPLRHSVMGCEIVCFNFVTQLVSSIFKIYIYNCYPANWQLQLKRREEKNNIIVKNVVRKWNKQVKKEVIITRQQQQQLLRRTKNCIYIETKDWKIVSHTHSELCRFYDWSLIWFVFI